LVENRDEEVFFSVFRLPDTMMHHTDSEREMVRSYDVVADFLGEFLEEFVNENDSMVVASDHGAVRYEKEFHANAWLEERGLLVREEGSESLMDDLVLSIADFGRKLGLRDFLVRLNSLAERTVDKDFSPGKSEVMDSIDWDETEAFAYVTGVCAYGGIWINDERLGGVVDEVEDKRSEIVGRLEGQDEVVWVRDSTDVYENPPESFPDLVVRLDERTKFESSLHPKTMSEVSGFMHRKQGFVASDRELVDDPELIDLAPTILHLLGDTVPEHMEGESMLKGKVEKEAKETSGIDF
jgi:predicted AlkP superfamily phosphohydrolase/phosphomutase